MIPDQSHVDYLDMNELLINKVAYLTTLKSVKNKLILELKIGYTKE